MSGTTHDVELAPVEDTAAEAPELTPRELARRYAENARAYDRQGRALTNRLRTVEGELAQARAALGSAIADEAKPETEAALHERIVRASETVIGIKAALAEVEKRADGFRLSEKSARLDAAEQDESEQLAIARQGEDNAHALIVDFVHELLGPIIGDARRAGQRANVARSEANVARAQIQPGIVHPFSAQAWENFRRYPGLEQVVRTLLDYAGNRTNAQQNASGAQSLLRMSQLHRDAQQLQDAQDLAEATRLLAGDASLKAIEQKEGRRSALLEALSRIEAPRNAPLSEGRAHASGLSDRGESATDDRAFGGFTA